MGGWEWKKKKKKALRKDLYPEYMKNSENPVKVYKKMLIRMAMYVEKLSFTAGGNVKWQPLLENNSAVS